MCRDNDLTCQLCRPKLVVAAKVAAVLEATVVGPQHTSSLWVKAKLEIDR